MTKFDYLKTINLKLYQLNIGSMQISFKKSKKLSKLRKLIHVSKWQTNKNNYNTF